jgi:putative methanogenesis marker protein 6
MNEYIPRSVGNVTKYVFVDSPDITPQTLALRAYEISRGVMIKETCFGIQVTGKPDEVARIIAELRTLDPPRIFVKDRGFPPGDPRRCRSSLGGARPGFYGHEYEIRLLRYISHGLEEVERGEKPGVPIHGADVLYEPKLDVKKLKKLIEAEEP